MRYFVTVDGREHTVDVRETAGGGHEVSVAQGDGAPAPIEATLAVRGGARVAHVGNRVFDVVLDRAAPDHDVYASGRRGVARVESARLRAKASMSASDAGAADGVLTSPMPGRVVKLLVKEGDEVAAGAPLCVVEAMKMENELSAGKAGVVQKVFVSAGDAVEGGAKLVLVG